MPLTDKDCVEKSLNGQAEAFSHLVDRYQGVVLGYLTGRLGSRELAEEAAQETFVRAYSMLGRLRKPESFFSWLLGIARRTGRELQRTEHRHRPAGVEIPRHGTEVDPAVDDDLERAVAELPPTGRKVILLRYYASLSCREIAERLDMPLGTVTKTLSRAYANLRKSLRRHERDG